MRKSWICRPPEIVRLQSSGRWDLGSHAHLGHVQIPIDDKLTGSLPHNPQYLPDQHRIETSDEYIARITHDLVDSTAQLVAHGLPEPEFFAYPLSAHSDDPENRTVASMFQAAMLDDVNLRATTSRDLAQRKLSRMDVVANLSLQEWGARLMTMSLPSARNL